MKKVLWLASWYPNRMDNYDGDFIQRHARAVSGYCQVEVIYVVKTKGEPGVEKIITGNLTETIIYYRSFQTGIKILDQYLSLKKYKQLYRDAISNYITGKGKPNCIHVHVAMNAGLAAFWANKKWGIPYILSEHWTAYLSNADQRIDNKPALFLKLIKQVFEHAKLVTVVSDHLGKAIQEHFSGINYQVIPNVLDTDVFFPVAKIQTGKCQLIHVSNMNYQKNTEDILRALQLVYLQRRDFCLQLFGPVHHNIHQLINLLGLKNNIFMNGEVKQTVLAKAMQQANVLILYSRFETFGCVLIEANACGVPVIVSDITVFHELVEENVNGVFVKGEDAVALAKAISKFMEGNLPFNPDIIAGKAALKYSFKTVGQQFGLMYDNITA